MNAREPAMDLLHTADDLQRLEPLRAGAAPLVLVPTMGALHAGHLALVDHARSRGPVVVSIFVNPTQFGPGEDFDAYPRDLARDLALLRDRHVAAVYAPAASDLFPPGERVMIAPGPAARGLCGAARPGHFRGVLTVVAKLFGLFTPDVAVFGQKDFQQAALIRRMVADLDYGVQVEIAPTVREADGLAMSSRNVYLSAAERERALLLPAALTRASRLWDAGEGDAEVLRAAMRSGIRADGVVLEYAEVVDPQTLERLSRVYTGAVCAVAARIGATRLIDNVALGVGAQPAGIAVGGFQGAGRDDSRPGLGG
jgi:pantoate--beta-alanine ligase